MAENIFPYELPESWQWVKLVGDFAECLDNFRSPINASERAKRIGNVPYYGATGQIGWIDDFLTDEQLVLLGEDGAPFLDSFKNKAYIIEGKAWVNNHAHILRSYFGNAGNKFMKYYLNNFDFADYVTGTTRLKLTQSKMKEIVIPLPPIDEQKKIVERLESLFSKLDAAKEKVQTVLDGYELRRSVILHKAFTGELSKKFRTENNLSLDDWHEVTMDDIFTLKAGKNISATEISSVQTPVNQYPCFGGNGIRGFVNSYNSEGNFPIIGRQGALCGNINMATGKFYATEHAVVVTFKKKIESKWAENYLRYLNLNQYATATAQPGLAVKKNFESKNQLYAVRRAKRNSPRHRQLTCQGTAN